MSIKEETKEKLSKSLKNKTPWNKGKKTGPLSESHRMKISNGNKGKTRTQETKDKISNARRNKKHTEESKQKNREKHLNKKASEETKKLMSVSHKDQIPWNKGLTTPIEIRIKMSKSMTGIKKSEEFRKNMSGENNLNWKGGVSTIEHAIRSLPEMNIWRSQVFKRDGYKDCFTGIIGNHNIEAHHIIAVALIIEMYNIKTIEDALNCKLLWDVDNGVTIFKDSHMEHHKKFKLTIFPRSFYYQKSN